MAKLMNNTETTVKISIDQIVLADNIRKNYQNIEELAESIKTKGQLQAVLVRPLGNDTDGLPSFELIAGYRRFHAIKLLRDQGEDFSMIEAKIKSGDREILQLVENIQRNDLDQEELRAGIKKMLGRGMPQVEIGRELNKSKQWVSDVCAGIEVLETAEAAGINTTGITPKAASQLRAIPAEQQPAAVAETKDQGGTVKAATGVMRKYKRTVQQKKQNSKEAKPLTIHKENFPALFQTLEQYKKKIISEEIIPIFENYIQKCNDQLTEAATNYMGVSLKAKIEATEELKLSIFKLIENKSNG